MARRQKIKPKDLDSIVEEEPLLIRETVKPAEVKQLERGVNKVVVALPTFSPKLRMIEREQFEKGITTERATLRLSDGTVLNHRQNFLVELTEEVKKLLKDGVLWGGGKTYK